MVKKKTREWSCNKVEGNNEIECDSQRGTGVSLQSSGKVRFSKFDCDTEVKVDGKIQKDKCGVELY